jgi:hypothetical protein
VVVLLGYLLDEGGPYDPTRTAEELWGLPVRGPVAEHRQTLPDFVPRVMTQKVRAYV